MYNICLLCKDKKIFQKKTETIPKRVSFRFNSFMKNVMSYVVRPSSMSYIIRLVHTRDTHHKKYNKYIYMWCNESAVTKNYKNVLIE